MLSKQLTTKLKEEQEKENQNSSAHLNATQCDRLIRTVSCKHDPNTAIKRSNINVLQTFEEIKLYSTPPVLLNSNQNSKENKTVGDDDQLLSTQTLDATTATVNLTNSTKLPRRNESMRHNTNSNDPLSEINEINLKFLLDQIVDNLTLVNVQNWFSSDNTCLNTLINSSTSPTSETPTASLNNQISKSYNLFESIQQALSHIDFNLKRNSDFINELTKLLDTSRAIKQETQLKKLLKELNDEKVKTEANNNFSPPASPNTAVEDKKGQKTKSKSFRGFTSSLTASASPKVKVKEVSNTVTSSSGDNNSLNKNLLSPNYAIASKSTQPGSNSSSVSNIELSFNRELKLNQIQTNSEINNADYIELEIEVEKISYHLDTLFRVWSKLNILNSQFSLNATSNLKNSIEFQSLINSLNSNAVFKELEQSLFKLNWLITSKSGFSEPNWHTSVISLTPSTIDSFIGVNLLKNYYKYVKYDFVTYKLFTRQLQLTQICAIILNIVHRILIFYRECSTLSSITSTFNGLYSNGSSFSNANLISDNQSLLSFTFSADKYRPISWSANHVTLYNVENNKKAPMATTTNATIEPTSPTSPQTPTALNQNNQGQLLSFTASSRSPSIRRTVDRYGSSNSHVSFNGGNSREEQMRQIKNDLFIKDVNDFLKLSIERLNLQASLTNRTGYFYIVNQSTGLVLQAVDFNSTFSLKEQIEQNQKRLQNSSIKHHNTTSNSPKPVASGLSKGPRFYLMPKKHINHAKSVTNQQNNSISSSLHSEAADDEQLWYYYLINGCIANKIIRSGHCMAASSLNAKSPVCFWPNVKTTNCSWFYNSYDQTIVSGLSDDLVLDYMIVDEQPNQKYSVVIDTKVEKKASQKWSFEFC